MHSHIINSRVNTNKMGFCALNAVFWAATAGFVGGMASPAAAQARGMTAHGQYMAKKQEKVRCDTRRSLAHLAFFFYPLFSFLTCLISRCYPDSPLNHRRQPQHTQQEAVAQAVAAAEAAKVRITGTFHSRCPFVREGPFRFRKSETRLLHRYTRTRINTTHNN